MKPKKIHLLLIPIIALLAAGCIGIGYDMGSSYVKLMDVTMDTEYKPDTEKVILPTAKHKAHMRLKPIET